MEKLQRNEELQRVLTHMNQQLIEFQSAMRILQRNNLPQRPVTAHALELAGQPNDPYNRLTSNADRGVVEMENLTQGSHTAIIFGLNGYGGMIAEALCRSGIRHLILIDHTFVNEADLSRMFFQYCHVGYSRALQARQILKEINPDVNIEAVDQDIGDNKGREAVLATIRRAQKEHSSQTTSITQEPVIGVPILMIICNLYEGLGHFVNTVSLDMMIPFLNVQVGVDGMTGFTRFINPGNTACLDCPLNSRVAKRLSQVATIDTIEHCLPRTAPLLPSTDILLAGIASHCAIKLLFDFGKKWPLTIVSGILDEVDVVEQLEPHRDCPNKVCRLRYLENQ